MDLNFSVKFEVKKSLNNGDKAYFLDFCTSQGKFKVSSTKNIITKWKNYLSKYIIQVGFYQNYFLLKLLGNGAFS